MRPRFLIALAFLAQALPPHAHAQSAGDAVEMVRGAVQDHIRPAYEEFAQATETLHDRVEALCRAPSAGSLSEAREAFDRTVDTWAGIELVRFGPVVEENRLERVFYWPDRRSTGLKQVQGILATEDPSAAGLETLVQKSVAVQGLGSLEYVLFGTGSDELSSSAGFRCTYGETIAANLEGIARYVSDAWTGDDGIARLWTSPGPDNPLFRSGDESLSELMDVAIHGLELVRDVRLNGFLGETAEDDRPKQALFWRSQQTLPAIRANLQSIDAILRAAEVAEHLPDDKRWIAGSIAFDFANADRALEELGDEPIADVLADPAKRAKLDYVRIVTSGLSDQIGRLLTGEFGLTAGFSSLDGD